MRFNVIVQPVAEAEIGAVHQWIHRRSPQSADRWLDKLQTAINSLDFMPFRCPLAPESALSSEAIHQFLYGRGQRRYRVLFIVRKTTVHVIHVRHWARAKMRRTSIRLPGDEG